MKGDFPEHWVNKKQWSLKIEMLDGNSIMGMNEFSITRHVVRQFPVNQIIANMIREENIFTPKFKTVKLYFNGNDWGPMIVEEQPSKYYSEIRKSKHTFFTRFGNEDWRIYYDLVRSSLSNFNASEISKYQGIFELDLSNEAKINYDYNKNLLSRIKNFQYLILQDPSNQDILNFIDKKSFAISILYSLIFGEDHSFLKANVRYYINPYTSHIHIIPTDHGGVIDISSESKINKFLDTIPRYIIYLFRDKEFRDYFLNHISYLGDDFKIKVEKNLEKNCIHFGKVCHVQFLKQKLKIFKNFSFINDNSEQIIKIFNNKDFKESRDPDILLTNESYLNLINKFLHIRAFNNNEIHFYNLLPKNVNINRLTFLTNCKLKNLKSINSKKFYLKPKEYKDCLKENYVFEKKLIISKKTSRVNKFVFKHNLSENIKFNYVDIEYSIDNNVRSEILNLENNFYSNNNFMVYENKPLLINGKKNMERPILLENQNLIIKGGSEIALSKGAYIHVKNGCLIIKKNKNKKTTVYFKDYDSNGIFIENCKDTTVIENTIFKNLSYFKNSQHFLTGGINIYNSNIKIDDVSILNSSAEDAINIVKSKFEINQILIEDSLSDAIDIDFSVGSIQNVKIKNAGGDGLDFSGSNIVIDNSYVSDVKDKALSIGEKSNLNLNYLEIKNNNIGVATKDESKVFIKNALVDSNLIDFMVFSKKNIYGSAIMKIDKSNYNNYVLEKGHSLIINNDNLKQTQFNLKDFYN